MNREDRRKTAKELRSKMGYTQSVGGLSKLIKQAIESQTEEAVILEDGNKVRINTELIMSKNGFEIMSDDYKTFIKESKGKTFTAHLESNGAFSLVEEPKWLFLKTELVRITDEDCMQGGDSV